MRHWRLFLFALGSRSAYASDDLKKNKTFRYSEAHSQRNEHFLKIMRIEENVKNAYKNIFAQKFSTDGKFLFLGDNFGSVHVVDCMTWNRIVYKYVEYLFQNI